MIRKRGCTSPKAGTGALYRLLICQGRIIGSVYVPINADTPFGRGGVRHLRQLTRHFHKLSAFADTFPDKVGASLAPQLKSAFYVRMTQRLNIDIPHEFPPSHRSDQTVREAMEIEIRGLKKAREAIDEAAEILGVPNSNLVGD